MLKGHKPNCNCSICICLRTGKAWNKGLKGEEYKKHFKNEFIIWNNGLTGDGLKKHYPNGLNNRSGKNNSMYGKHHTEEAKRKMREKKIKPKVEIICDICGKSEMVKPFLSKKTVCKSPECLSKWLSKRLKENNPMRNRKYLQKMLETQSKNGSIFTIPNQKEIWLIEYLEKKFPDEWDFVGNGSLTVNMSESDSLEKGTA